MIRRSSPVSIPVDCDLPNPQSTLNSKVQALGYLSNFLFLVSSRPKNFSWLGMDKAEVELL